jgi:HEAT repeat protein
LQKRAARGDDVGAEAEMMLLEARRVDGSSLIRRHAESRNGAFRALAARAAASRASGTLRRRYMLDPDERVRRAAFRAALEARDPGDLEPLLEAGRLDPDAMSRSLATRAAGSIGTQQAVFSLQDFWARADTAERIAIVDAWAMPAALAAGGRERLVRVIETTSGTPALAAADALIRRRGDESGLARSVLLQALKSGSTEERRFAAARVPLEPTTQDALLAASRSDDPAVSVSALRRLLDVPTRRTAAVTSLRALASRDDSTASEARGALASAGDAAARPALQRALTAKQPAARREAALGLIELGDFTSAATALADDDPLVRADVACAMLASD